MTRCRWANAAANKRWVGRSLVAKNSILTWLSRQPDRNASADSMYVIYKIHFNTIQHKYKLVHIYSMLESLTTYNIGRFNCQRLISQWWKYQSRYQLLESECISEKRHEWLYHSIHISELIIYTKVFYKHILITTAECVLSRRCVSSLTISVRHAHLAATPLVTFLYTGHYSGFDKLCHSKCFNL